MKRALLLPLALAACADRSGDRDPLAGRIAGEPVDCIALAANTSPQILENGTILYRETNRRVWRTQPVGVCPGLRPLDRLIVQVYGTQLCRNDQFQAQPVNSRIPGGICRFDRFTPYDLPPRP